MDPVQAPWFFSAAFYTVELTTHKSPFDLPNLQVR